MLQRFKGHWFVLDAYQTLLNAELFGSHFRRSALAATEKGQLHANTLQQAYAQSIAYVKTFLQLTLPVKPKAPIGEHPIHIQHQQFKLLESLALSLPMPFA